VSFNLNHDCLDWLIDTGASISVVSKAKLACMQIPIHTETICINGVGGKVYSEGFVFLTLKYNEEMFTHKFYVFNKLSCQTDGILGQDFLIK
jgi:hypothetical protein